MSWKKFLNLPIFLPIIFLFCLIFFAGTLNKKLVGHHDWNSVVYASSARSLIGKAETGEIFYQQDYSPLLPLSLSFSFLLFGIKDWSVRLVSVTYTFLTAVMIFLFTKKLWNKKQALIASILYLNTPLIRYFGKIPVHETITPFFALLIFYFYWMWFKENTFKKYLFLLVSIFLAEQVGWPGYYPVPLISLHYFFFNKKKKLFYVLNWWFISFLSFGLFLLTDLLITGKFPLEGLWQIFLTRAALKQDNIYGFTWLQFLAKELLWLRVYLTRILSVFVLIWFMTFIFSLRGKKKLESKEALLILLGLFGLTHLFLFRQLCWLHDYMIIYLFPFLVIVASKSLLFLTKRIKWSYLFVLIFVLSLMYLESKSFLQALEAQQDFYPAYQLGAFVKKITQPGEKIFIASKESSKLYGVFFYFYANRSYAAGEPSLKEFLENVHYYKENYRFFVVDEGHNRLQPELIEFLSSYYKQQKVDDFLLFDLKET